MVGLKRTYKELKHDSLPLSIRISLSLKRTYKELKQVNLYERTGEWVSLKRTYKELKLWRKCFINRSNNV